MQYFLLNVTWNLFLQDEGVRRETLSSNSSSSESVNSQEGLSVGGSGKKQPPTTPRTRTDALEQRHQELLRKQKLLQDQYTRLQQLQSSQHLLHRLQPQAAPSLLNDLKKTGSESNILSKAGLGVTAATGSLTHLAGKEASVNFNKPAAKTTSAPPATTSNAVSNTVTTTVVNKGPAVPAKPTLKNKIYETDIL